MYGGQPERTDRDIYDERPQDLQKLSRMEGYTIAEGDPDIRGWGLFDGNDDKIGKVDDLLISIANDEAVFLIARYGDVMGIGGDRTVIPLNMIRLDRDKERAYFMGNADRIKNAPKLDDDTRDYGQFYDYWAGGFGAPAEGRELREDIVEKRERVIPEVEERMEIGKHEEQVGEVRARKEIETHRETVSEPVRKTRVHVMRRAVEPGREVTPGERVLHEGETIEVPIVEEKLETTKRAEVTGEVVIQPETYEEEEEVSEELRKERVDVERRGEGVLDEEEEEEEELEKRRRASY